MMKMLEKTKTICLLLILPCVVATEIISTSRPSKPVTINDPIDGERDTKAVGHKDENDCNLTVSKQSKTYFTAVVLKHKYNYVNLKLEFGNISVGETKLTVEKYKWVWTFKGENGGYQYLFFPNDFPTMSLSLLGLYVGKSDIRVQIDGTCKNLTIGDPKSDQLVGNALAEMTSDLASRDRRYNTSHWCYYSRLWLDSDVLYYTCKNAVCYLQTIDYTCCRYITDLLNGTRYVKCSIRDHPFGVLWWAFPLFLSNLFFVVYPLLVMSVVLTLSQFISQQPVDNGHNGYIKVNQIPVSFFYTVTSPLMAISIQPSIGRRVVRVLALVLPSVLVIIHVTVEYNCCYDFILAGSKKGALLSFSSMATGFEISRHEFLAIFGGPYIAIGIYILFGCSTLCLVNDLETALAAGLYEPNSNIVMSLISLPMSKREKFSRIYLGRTAGYKRIHMYMKMQIFMLVDYRFWTFTGQLYCGRWRQIYYTLKRKLRLSFIFVLVILFPCYITLCVVETVVAVTLFMFPVLNCFLLLLRAYVFYYFKRVSESSKLWKCLRLLAFFPLIVCFFISWYMYCTLFFDGFLFLCKVAMFTYTGIVAYPKVSYGYIILLLMAVNYLAESAIQFGENYKSLLKMTFDVCQKIETQRADSNVKITRKRSIPLDLFELIIEHHMPRRRQVLTTLMKFVTIFTVLAVSIQLFITFDKFQDISVISHVFTVIFICSLPKIFHVMCLKNHRHTAKRTLRKKIKMTLEQYLFNRNSDRAEIDNESDQGNNEEHVLCERRCLYDTLN